MRAAPIAAERIPKSDRNGAAAAAAAIPLRRNPILPIFFMCHFRSNLAPLFRI
jgi:hypothetical protein